MGGVSAAVELWSKIQMKPHKRHSRGMLPCESMGPEDGIDAHDLFRGSSREKSNHKAHQLCKQVMETINFLLAGDLDDARLQSVFVDEATPAPDESAKAQRRSSLPNPLATYCEARQGPPQGQSRLVGGCLQMDGSPGVLGVAEGIQLGAQDGFELRQTPLQAQPVEVDR